MSLYHLARLIAYVNIITLGGILRQDNICFSFILLLDKFTYKQEDNIIKFEDSTWYVNVWILCRVLKKGDLYMSMDDYKEALKSGQKAYREAITKGAYPYLPVLEDIISFTNIETESNLGLVEIPMNLIVGTKSAGRTTSFASNFMPLLAADTEFSAKWASLSTMLQQEGLRDPIKAYEYMNHFYVMEGNKRVSVMKYFGAVSIPGTVIRVVPKRNNTKENKLYYEFMNFYMLSSINYLIFTELGAYRKLQAAVGKKPDEPWNADEQKDFHSFYIRFEKAYNEKAGSRPPMPVSDAILVYLNIYPYEISRNHMPSNFKVNLTKSWEEFLVHKEEQAVALSMKPEADAKKNIITMLFKETKPKYHVAFIHDKSAETSGWTYGHELGRLHLEQKFPDRIHTSAYSNVNPNDTKAAVAVIEEAIADGNEIIFTTTPKLLKASLKAAVDHPDIKILNCSLNTTHPSIRAYYGRMYEAKFLIGAIAGVMSEIDNIGYIADYPIYGMTANINAFALGAKMVNPRAKIYLEWSTVKDRNIHENLKNNGACFISDRDIIVPKQASRQFGLYHEASGMPENMATPVWHWGKFYELIIRSILSGSWKSYEPSSGIKALNYWWGMSAGVIDVICSQNLPEGTRRLVKLLRDNICSGEFNPFSGVLIDNNGQLRHEAEKPMAPEEIITMNWLVDNVVGYIPIMAELTDEAKQIVAVQGVNKTESDDIINLV